MKANIISLINEANVPLLHLWIVIGNVISLEKKLIWRLFARKSFRKMFMWFPLQQGNEVDWKKSSSCRGTACDRIVLFYFKLAYAHFNWPINVQQLKLHLNWPINVQQLNLHLNWPIPMVNYWIWWSRTAIMSIW